MEELRQFIEGSETFSCFTFKGNYDMPKDVFIKLFSHYILTGENHLDTYSKCVYLLWDSNHTPTLLTYDEIDNYEYCVSKARRLQLFDYNSIHKIKNYLRTCRITYRDYLEKIRNEPRVKACIFTSKKEVKEYIYNKHGNKCLCCGSTDKISLDHVIPVSLGGEDCVSNLQPLCKSCNSRKGTKTTDYRNVKI